MRTHLTLALSFSLLAATSLAHADKPTPKDAKDSKETPAAPAEKGKWEKLGERSVDGKLDKDTIVVGRDDGLFDSIQLKVEGSSVAIFDIKVTFLDGKTFEPKTKVVFAKDTKSHVIDLPGDKRGIKKVELKYGNLAGGGKASVELWGRDVSGDKGKDKGKDEKGDKDKDDKGWDKLGERTVDGKDGKADKDVIVVGAKDGTFTAIRVKVEGSAIEMRDIKVTFADGKVFDPKTKLLFGKDTWTKVIDLPGEKRVIKKVEFVYSNVPGGGKARVELWGKH